MTSANTTTLKSITDLLQQFGEQRPIRGGSLIISVFGDSISKHGGSIWLGSLIDILAPFGLNERLVRTSVFRLVQDGWLTSIKVGRKSYYRLTSMGLNHTLKSERRIYAAQRVNWNNEWTLVIPVDLADEIKDTLKKDLSWLGFSALTSGVFAHPGLDRRSLDETLRELGVEKKVIVMKASTEDADSFYSLKTLSYKTWDISTLESKYQVFLERFRPVINEINQGDHLSDEQCFQVRTMVIHQYRKILLKDSDLPLELLPEDWAGQSAFNLRENLYREVYAKAERFIVNNLQSSEGPLPRADSSFYQRFGGLKR